MPFFQFKLLRHFFCFICACKVVSKQCCNPLRMRVRFYGRLFAQNMPITGRDTIVSALNTIALLNLGPADRTERDLLTRFVQNSNKLAVSENVLVPLLASDDHSLSLLSNDTKKMMAEHEEWLKNAKEKKNVCCTILGCRKP